MSHSFSSVDLSLALGSMTPREKAVVWLLQGARLGDNQQVLALGAALEARFGWRMVVKQLKFERVPVPGSHPADGISHVKLNESSPIHATPADPWPDVIISVGRRAAPVARWIKMQNAPFAIHVQLGRFQDPYETVDLLVTTAQYGLPGARNVLQLSLPINSRKPDALARAATAFAPLFDEVTQASIGVLVGGPSSPVKFSAKDGERLAREALVYAAKSGARLLIATSPRTPPEVVEYFSAMLQSPHMLFPFAPGLGERNPYPALLACCQSFIVTNDSVSMVADAVLTGREVRVFDLPITKPRTLWRPSWPISSWVGRRRNQRLARGARSDVLDRWFEAHVRRARAQPVRYVPIIMTRLLKDRHVALMSDPEPPRTDLAELVAGELDRVVARILALLADRRAEALRQSLAGLDRPALHRRLDSGLIEGGSQALSPDVDACLNLPPSPKPER